MKKITSFSALLFAGIMLTGTSALAAPTYSSNTKGAMLTMSGSSVPGGPDLTFSPSPNNLLATDADSTYYAIQSMNAVAADGDRMEYGIYSSNSGYYQKVNGDAAASPAVTSDFTVDLSAVTDLTSSPFPTTGADAWAPIGGGGS